MDLCRKEFPSQRYISYVSSGTIDNIVCSQVNPFKDRICTVFSSGTGNDTSLSFEDFLDMMSVFSDSCPKNVKVEYAFRIYGAWMGLFYLYCMLYCHYYQSINHHFVKGYGRYDIGTILGNLRESWI